MVLQQQFGKLNGKNTVNKTLLEAIDNNKTLPNKFLSEIINNTCDSDLTAILLYNSKSAMNTLF